MNFLDPRLPDRFWSKCIPEPNGGCWLWIGATLKIAGYGRFWSNGLMRQSHRIAYASLHGAIPEGLDLDHLCRVRVCCNPAHLEAVTRRVNLLRGETITAKNANKQCCPLGHPYDDENTYTYRGKRDCRACNNLQAQRYYRRRIGAR